LGTPLNKNSPVFPGFFLFNVICNRLVEAGVRHCTGKCRCRGAQDARERPPLGDAIHKKRPLHEVFFYGSCFCGKRIPDPMTYMARTGPDNPRAAKALIDHAVLTIRKKLAHEVAQSLWIIYMNDRPFHLN